MDHSEAIARFSSVTGADLPTAEHFLAASNWDLNSSINFYVESGASTAFPAVDDPQEPSDGRVARQQAQAQQPIDDQAAAFPPHELDGDDEDLQAALAASLDTSGTAAPRHSRTVIEVENDEDLDDADLRVLADHQRNASAPPVDLTEEDTPPGARRRAAQGPLFPPHPAHAALEQELAAIGVPAPLHASSNGLLHGRHRQAAASQAYGGSADAELDLPAGINIEEARMLEAAMLGLPYSGHMPDFTAGASAPYANGRGEATPLSPTVRAQRQLRQEQDDAFHASLKADREKADAERRAAQALKDAEEAKARALAEEQAALRRYERQLTEKQAGLPAEPSALDPDAVTVLVRMPNGSRIGRRFTRSSSLAYLFDFVDVQAAGELKPGTYRLVTQYPRRVYTADLKQSLEDVGLNQKQEAVFLEMLS